jgi:DnaA family protein
MRQLPLDISPPAPPTLENFVAGRNAELLATLQQIRAGHCKEHFVTLWGEPGCGRGHLLQALAGSIPIAEGQLVHCATPELTLVNRVTALDTAAQQVLFNRYNQIREQGHGSIVVSADAAPLQLNLREDLRTRLGWGLVFQVLGLSDQEKSAALYNQARARGLQLAADVVPWLLTHYRRDMPSLSALLDALDKYSLEKKRAVTLPLLRELLKSGET